MSGLIALIAAGFLLLFWMDSLRARERAVQASAHACRQTNNQFLDQTVSLAGLGIGRAANGRILLRRRYRFDFSTDGVDRWQGRVILLGPVVEWLQLDSPEGATIVDTDVYRE